MQGVLGGCSGYLGELRVLEITKYSNTETQIYTRWNLDDLLDKMYSNQIFTQKWAHLTLRWNTWTRIICPETMSINAAKYSMYTFIILHIVAVVYSWERSTWATTAGFCSKPLGCISCHLSQYFHHILRSSCHHNIPVCATRGIVQHSKKPIPLQGIFIYGSRDIKSHLARQEMDRILNSGRLCNACHLLQVANITQVWAHAQAEIFAWGHISLGDGDKARG